MNKIQKFQYSRLVFTALLLALTGATEATIVQRLENKLEFPGYNTASGVDLVNSDQPSLRSITVSQAPHGNFPASNLNDGISDSAAIGKNVYFPSLPSIITFTLNTSVNTQGYDITGVTTFAGWDDNKGQFANQQYALRVKFVGDADFTDLYNVLYAPIANGTAAAASSVGLSDSSGVMATGVEAVQFELQSHNSSFVVYQEIDVIGVASIPMPATLGLVAIYSAPSSIEDVEFPHSISGLIN